MPLDSQEMSPALREGYQKELDSMLHPPLTKRMGSIGVVPAVGLLVCVGLIVRADLFYHVRGLMLVGNLALGDQFMRALALDHSRFAKAEAVAAFGLFHCQSPHWNGWNTNRRGADHRAAGAI